jgi:hypothetical protein
VRQVLTTEAIPKCIGTGSICEAESRWIVDAPTSIHRLFLMVVLRLKTVYLGRGVHENCAMHHHSYVNDIRPASEAPK